MRNGCIPYTIPKCFSTGKILIHYKRFHTIPECSAGLTPSNLQVVVVIQLYRQRLEVQSLFVVKGDIISEPNKPPSTSSMRKTFVVTCSVPMGSVRLFIYIHCDYNDYINIHAHEHSGNTNNSYTYLIVAIYAQNLAS